MYVPSVNKFDITEKDGQQILSTFPFFKCAQNSLNADHWIICVYETIQSELRVHVQYITISTFHDGRQATSLEKRCIKLWTSMYIDTWYRWN